MEENTRKAALAPSFDAVAWGYDLFMRSWGLYAPGRVLERAGGGGLLVDLCGGTGYLGALLKGRYSEVIVADASERMLEKARARGLLALRCDCAAVPLPDSCADAVLVSDALHHVPSPAALLAESRRLLRPGGRLLIRDFDARRPLVRAFGRLESVLFGPLRYLKPAEAAALVSDAGFRAGPPENAGKYFIIAAVRP